MMRDVQVRSRVDAEEVPTTIIQANNGATEVDQVENVDDVENLVERVPPGAKTIDSIDADSSPDKSAMN